MIRAPYRCSRNLLCLLSPSWAVSAPKSGARTHNQAVAATESGARTHNQAVAATESGERTHTYSRGDSSIKD
jgi:hypothetical protein